MRAPMRTMLQANELDETIRFYVEMLDFTLDGTWGPTPDGPATWCSLDYGPAGLMFTHGSGGDATGPALTGSLYFYPDDVDALHRSLVERGLKTLNAPSDREYGMRDFAVEDPNGYLLQFGQPIGENPEHG
jgi:catechol 2,3-dioxygenase-like lactoylglutathione lyase family enzyme